MTVTKPEITTVEQLAGDERMADIELGSRITGDKIGRSPKSIYTYVRCVARLSPDCHGDRWSTISKGRYQPEGHAFTQYRDCRPCGNWKNRHNFKLGPKPMPTRVMY